MPTVTEGTANSGSQEEQQARGTCSEANASSDGSSQSAGTGVHREQRQHADLDPGGHPGEQASLEQGGRRSPNVPLAQSHRPPERPRTVPSVWGSRGGSQTSRLGARAGSLRISHYESDESEVHSELRRTIDAIGKSRKHKGPVYALGSQKQCPTDNGAHRLHPAWTASAVHPGIVSRFMT